MEKRVGFRVRRDYGTATRGSKPLFSRDVTAALPRKVHGDKRRIFVSVVCLRARPTGCIHSELRTPNYPAHAQDLMEFDWLDVNFDLGSVSPREIEEAFEDPFAVRLLPDYEGEGNDPRYFCLGRSVSNKPIFSLFWTDGKKYRVILAREMTEQETTFYERKNAEFQ